MRVEDILSDLIVLRTDDKTVSNQMIVNYICQILQANEVVYQRVLDDDGIKENIIAGINVTELKNIETGLVLLAHLDTVKANDDEWQTSPFEARCVDGAIYGRGAVDMKYFIAEMLALIPEFKKTGLPIVFLFSSDEETDVNGIRKLLFFMRQQQIKPKIGVVGEPTHFRLCVAHKGYAGFKTIVKGKSSHSGMPELGVNAIYIVAKIVSKLEELNKQFANSGITINVGQVQGGVGGNSVPCDASLVWDIRFENEIYKHQIVQEIERFQQHLISVYPRAEICLETRESLPAYVCSKDSEAAKVIRSFFSVEDVQFSYATEAGFLQQYGVDVIVWGAGDETLAHMANEHICCADLHKFAKLLLKFVANLQKNQLFDKR